MSDEKTDFEVRLSIDQLSVAILEYCTSKQLFTREGKVRVVVHVGAQDLVVSGEAAKTTVSDPLRTLSHVTRQRDDLWHLLENIDTLDIALEGKEHNESFRNVALMHARRRFEIYNPEKKP